MKPRSVVIAALALVVVAFSIYRFWNQPKKLERTFYPMGGIPFRVVEYGVTEEKFIDDMKAVEAEVEKMEGVFNIHRSESEVSNLNAFMDDSWHGISKDLYDAFELALTWFGKTGGAFDVTVLPLINLWNEAGKKGMVPSDVEIKETLMLVGSSKITLSPDKGVRFGTVEMQVDFGGIAKGIILDSVGSLLESRGVQKYVLSAGGDVLMKGKESFKVGVQEPSGKNSDLMMVLDLPPGSVVTSGHYERYLDVGGVKYSHIMDPETGWPVDNNLKSVTIVAKNATDADALATAVAVLGFEKSANFFGESDDFEAVLLVERDGKFEIHYSKSLSGQIKFLDKWKNVPHMSF